MKKIVISISFGQYLSFAQLRASDKRLIYHDSYEDFIIECCLKNV